jgi:hypothetical protein
MNDPDKPAEMPVNVTNVEPTILEMPGTIGSAKLVFPKNGLETLDLLDKIDKVGEYPL